MKQNLNLAGSEIQKLSEGKIFGKAPEIDLDVEKQRQQQILEAIQAGTVKSAHDLSEGGLAVALAEAVFEDSSIGAIVSVSGDAVTELFSETQSRFLLSVSPDQQEAFEAIVKDAKRIGTVTNDAKLTIQSGDQALVEADKQELQSAWKGAIPCLLK